MAAVAATPSPIVPSETQDWWWDTLRSVAQSMILLCCPAVTLPGFLLLPLRRSHQGAIVTGTVLCPEGDRVSLCLQKTPSSPPYLLLDLPISTQDFAHEIASGTCRVTLECNGDSDQQRQQGMPPILDAPQWAVCINGRRRPGWATRRAGTAEKEEWVLRTFGTVTTGAGTLMRWGLPARESKPMAAPPHKVAAVGGGWCKYLRGDFERVVGCDGSETYHLVDPTRSLDGQDLSFFFLRH